MRKIVVFSASGAVVLVAAAAVLRFAVLPGLTQIPADLDTTLRYTGTADLVDTAAVQSGDAAGALRTGVPVTVEERIRTASVHGSTAVLTDEITASAAGATLLASRHRWAVDRRSLDAAPVPAGSGADPHEGLVAGFPLKPEVRDYNYWDTVTQSLVVADYRRTERRAGTETYVYTVHADGPLADPEVQAIVPTALSKATLLSLAGTLLPDRQGDLAAQAALLPEQIPLAYTASNDATFWVDTATGYVVDVNQKQTVEAALALGTARIPLATVFALDIKFAPETVNAVGDDAAAARDGLFLIGVVVPLALLAIAVLLVLLAIWRWRRGRAVRATAEEPVADGPAVPVDASARD